MASKVIDLVNQNSNIVIQKNGQSSDLSLFLLLHTCQLLMLAPKQMLVSLHFFYFSGGQIGTQIGAQIGLANVFLQPEILFDIFYNVFLQNIRGIFCLFYF